MRRKMFAFTMALLWVVAVCGCEESEPVTPDDNGPKVSVHDAEKDSASVAPSTPYGTTLVSGNGGAARCLVVYCSRTNVTQSVAKKIQSALNCDIVKIEPQNGYESDYNKMLTIARNELSAIAQGEYPQIKQVDVDFSKYNVVLVGYPIWHGHMATPMQAFLHAFDSVLAGKRIAFFATSGSSGMTTSVDEAKQLCKGAIFCDATMLLTSSLIKQADQSIATWLEKLGLAKEKPMSLRAKITIGETVVTATFTDNSASNDLLSRMPFDVDMIDFMNVTEKYFYPSPALDLSAVERGCSPKAGDICIYEPWQNVTVFCKDWSQSSSLIKIGSIDGNGINAFIVLDTIRAKFEQIEQ